MENERIIKIDAERTSPTVDEAGSAISRRQFSLEVSGMLFAGVVLASPESNLLSIPVAKTSDGLFAQTGSQKLAPYAFDQPQYVLSGTIGSAWSPDSRRIATFHENVVTLYNANTGKTELTYNKHTDEILAVKWSMDSKYLASSGFDCIVHVWDAAFGQTLTIYKGHTALVRDIVWSPNQHYLASAGYDKTVQVWEAFTGKMVVTCSGHTAEIQTLTWSPDGRFIASTDLQNKTMIWRVI